MALQILIEEYKENIWTVALNKRRLEAIEIDPISEPVRYGSVFYAKVTRIDAALDAAFLDLDGYSKGILFNKDVRTTEKDGKINKGGDIAIGKVFHPGDLIAVQAKSTYADNKEATLLEENKTPRMSMDITLPGRYLIYSATLKDNIISQRIRNKKTRKRLGKMISSLEEMQGFILRSAAAGLQTDILRREASILRAIWDKLKTEFTGSAPKLIMQGPNSIQRILSDMATQSIETIQIVTLDHYEQIEKWCAVFAPDLVTKIEPVALTNSDATLDLALLEHRDVIKQIKALLHDYTLLPSGGNITIEETAALTAIDINRGNDTRSNLSINIEAAKEIARQLRLRNIGGIIIIDFLKLGKKERSALLQAIEEGIYTDPCTVQLHGMTKLGLIELTRKRRTPPLRTRIEGVEL
ncbi:MAG: ribonuclease E/G [Alphaproteobacteria bacterium]